MLCKRCVCMKWGTVVALFGLAVGISFFCFFVLGAGLVLGREPPRVCLDVDGRACLDAPHTPTSSYHPKSVLIGICIYIIVRP